MDRLKQILKEVCKILDEHKDLTPSDDIIWDSVVRIYISEEINSKRERQVSPPQANQPLLKERPTQKQLDLLKKKNVKVMPETKAEARILIKELLEKVKGK